MVCSKVNKGRKSSIPFKLTYEQQLDEAFDSYEHLKDRISKATPEKAEQLKEWLLEAQERLTRLELLVTRRRSYD